MHCRLPLQTYVQSASPKEGKEVIVANNAFILHEGTIDIVMLMVKNVDDPNMDMDVRFQKEDENWKHQLTGSTRSSQ